MRLSETHMLAWVFVCHFAAMTKTPALLAAPLFGDGSFRRSYLEKVARVDARVHQFDEGTSTHRHDEATGAETHFAHLSHWRILSTQNYTQAQTMSGNPKGPYRLVTVNNAPERAKLLIGRVTSDLKDRYTIDYVGNCTSELCLDTNIIQAHEFPVTEL